MPSALVALARWPSPSQSRFWVLPLRVRVWVLPEASYVYELLVVVLPVTVVDEVRVWAWLVPLGG